MTGNSTLAIALRASNTIVMDFEPAVFHAVILPRYPEVNRERVLVVGDTDADIRFARNIEAASCWASYGYGRREVCSALKPDYTIESPSLLLEVIA